MKFKYILVLFIIFIFPMSVEADRIYNLDMDVYLDNSSTTFPKPKQVIDGIYNYMLKYPIESEIILSGGQL